MIEMAWMRSARHAGTQAADAADDELDVHAGLAGHVQFLDQRAIDEAVDLDDHASVPAGAGVAGLATDPRDEPRPEIGRRHQQMVEAGWPRVR